MTLLGAILEKVKSKDSIHKKYYSPPPELDEDVVKKKKRKYVNKYSGVAARVDCAPPPLQPRFMSRHLAAYSQRIATLYTANLKLLTAIKRQHFLRGRVDSRWRELPPPSRRYFENRRNFLHRVEKDNKFIYNRIITTNARVTTTRSLLQDWCRTKQEMAARATRPFVLFPIVPQETMEDAAFVAPPGVQRPRVYIRLGIRGGCALGELTIELFSEVCPRTAALFLDLADGDGLGHGYVGTSFFTKVAGLYWRGGDVILDSGAGCYAQRGRRAPIGAENYHFSHAMPGLVSMRMTADDEMCGIFNITFKPLPQLDLKNVVFGRVVRPCPTYDAIVNLGSPLSSRPVVEVLATRRRAAGRAVCGQPNTRLMDTAAMTRGR